MCTQIGPVQLCPHGTAHNISAEGCAGADVPDSHIVGWMTVSNLSLRLGLVTSAMLSEWGFDTTSRLVQSL